MHLSKHMHTQAHTHTHTHTHTHRHIHTHTHAGTNAHTHTNTHTYKENQSDFKALHKITEVLGKGNSIAESERLQHTQAITLYSRYHTLHVHV